MKVLVTGATGLVGTALVKKLTESGYCVHVLTRKKSEQPNYFYWDFQNNEIDERAFSGVQAIVHLAGANIGKRWNDEYKKDLYTSRIDSALFLKEKCEHLGIRLKVFISASGINYYGTFTSNQILTEESPIIKQDFLAHLCEKWEAAAYKFNNISERVVCLRTGLVLSQHGGSFPPLQKMTRLNLGSPVGSGRQWMNWIHIDDLVRLYLYALENAHIKGSYNAIADEALINRDFMKTLAKKQNRLFWPIPIPALFLKLIFGEMSSLILEGTKASNEKIKSQRFNFKYTKLAEAVENLIR